MNAAHRQPVDKLRSLRLELRALGACGPSALASLAPKLSDALAIDGAVAFSLRTREGRARLGHGSETGIDGFLSAFDGLLGAHAPEVWSWLAPPRPRRGDANRVRAREELRAEGAFEPSNPVAALFTRFGLGRAGLLRVSVCDGDEALAHVAIFRHAPLGSGHREGLQSLVSPLAERLGRDRALAEAPSTREALRAKLSLIGAPAWVVTAALHVEHANTAGLAQLERERALTLERIRVAVQLRRSAAGLALTPIVGPGEPVAYLLVQQS